MKKLDTTNETSSSWSPYKVETKKFVQDSYSEMINALVLERINNKYVTDSVVVLWGCVNTGTGTTYVISAGAIYCNGEVYLLQALPSTVLATGAVCNLSDVPDSIADPTTFSDNATWNIHRVRTAVIANGASGSGTLTGTSGCDFNNFVPVKNNTYLSDDTSVIVASGTGYNSYATLTSSTPTAFQFTTPNDGMTRKYRIDFKSWYQQNVAVSSTTHAKLRLFDGTNQLDFTQVLAAAQPTNAQMQASCSLLYYGSIAPNTTISVQAMWGGGGTNGVDFANNKLLVEEMK